MAAIQTMNDIIDLISKSSCSSSEPFPPRAFCEKKETLELGFDNECSSVSSTETEISLSSPNKIGPGKFILNFSSGSSSSSFSSHSSEEEEIRKNNMNIIIDLTFDHRSSVASLGGDGYHLPSSTSSRGTNSTSLIRRRLNNKSRRPRSR